MTVTERPDPAVRRAPPRVTVAGNKARTALGVSTIRQGDETCPLCLNRANNVVIVFSRSPLMRAAVVVAVLCALVCAWVAWDARSDMVSDREFQRSLHKED